MLEDEQFQRLRQLLIKHEGVRLTAYKDQVGKVTIGVGRNLEDLGISTEEAMILLTNDMHRVEKEAWDNFGWYPFLTFNRRNAVLSMIFNLGLPKFKTFKKLIAALAVSDYENAASEMLFSKWADQVGQRAKDLAELMRKG